MEEFIKNLHTEINKYTESQKWCYDINTKNVCIHTPKCYLQKYIDMYNEDTKYPDKIKIYTYKEVDPSFDTSFDTLYLNCTSVSLNSDTYKNYKSSYNTLTKLNILNNLNDTQHTFDTLLNFHYTPETIYTFIKCIVFYIRLLPPVLRKEVVTQEAYQIYAISLNVLKLYKQLIDKKTLTNTEKDNWVTLQALEKVLNNLLVYRPLYIVLYCFLYICPLRSDIVTVKTKNYNPEVDNFIDINTGIIVFNTLIKTKGSMVFKLTEKDITVFKAHLATTTPTEEYLVPNKTAKTFSSWFRYEMAKELQKIGLGNKKIGIQMLRKILATEKTHTFKSPTELLQFIKSMNHTLHEHMTYYVKNL